MYLLSKTNWRYNDKFLSNSVIVRQKIKVIMLTDATLLHNYESFFYKKEKTFIDMENSRDNELGRFFFEQYSEKTRKQLTFIMESLHK